MSHTRNQMRAKWARERGRQREGLESVGKTTKAKKFTLQKSVAETFIKWPKPPKNVSKQDDTAAKQGQGEGQGQGAGA